MREAVDVWDRVFDPGQTVPRYCTDNFLLDMSGACPVFRIGGKLAGLS